MNNERRKALRRWNKRAEELKSDLESILWDEQNYYDNIPENLQFSERAEASEEAINQMEDAIDDLGDVIEAIDDIII